MSEWKLWNGLIKVRLHIVKPPNIFKSPQQARSWAIKAKEKGFEALVDNRGHRKPESELTELDKANLRIRQLESQIKDQQLLEAFIKKYQELQHKG